MRTETGKLIVTESIKERVMTLRLAADRAVAAYNGPVKEDMLVLAEAYRAAANLLEFHLDMFIKLPQNSACAWGHE
ncbi:MAG: hypothetical protein IPL79_20045 [Myxococcales bacterium]|nr:hypothetical protein [Myxococcales bacterium]